MISLPKDDHLIRLYIGSALVLLYFNKLVRNANVPICMHGIGAMPCTLTFIHYSCYNWLVPHPSDGKFKVRTGEISVERH